MARASPPIRRTCFALMLVFPAPWHQCYPYIAQFRSTSPKAPRLPVVPQGRRCLPPAARISFPFAHTLEAVMIPAAVRQQPELDCVRMRGDTHGFVALKLAVIRYGLIDLRMIAGSSSGAHAQENLVI